MVIFSIQIFFISACNLKNNKDDESNLAFALSFLIENSSYQSNNKILPVLNYSKSEFSYPQHRKIPKIEPDINENIIDCSIEPQLPSGLTISNDNCTIEGTPTEHSDMEEYKIFAKNDYGSSDQTIKLKIGSIPIEEVEATIFIESENLIVLKCGHGQNLTSLTCEGSLISIQYCNSDYGRSEENPNACNDSDSPNLVIKGPLFEACNYLNDLNEGFGFGGLNSWRLPIYEEILEVYFYYNANRSKFPNSDGEYLNGNLAVYTHVFDNIGFSRTAVNTDHSAHVRCIY